MTSRIAAQNGPVNSPSVVLVGRPNVGKSTLFNRITGSRRAIVAPIAGTTRDSLAVPAAWQGVDFQLPTPAGCSAPARIRCTNWWSSRASARLRGADLLVFLVDGREGLVLGRRDDRQRAAREPACR